jgi:hypothetical protein
MAERKQAFALILFTPDKVITSSEEFLMGGEGITVRVPLQQFLEQVDWATLATFYNAWRVEHDRMRKEQYEANIANGGQELYKK